MPSVATTNDRAFCEHKTGWEHSAELANVLASSTERGGKLYHAVSDQKRVKDKVQLGDAVWFATIEDHELILFGHMLVGAKISQSAVEKKFGEEVWSGECHLIPKAPERYVKFLFQIWHSSFALTVSGAHNFLKDIQDGIFRQ